jgi:stage II sporulation protein E
MSIVNTDSSTTSNVVVYLKNSPHFDLVFGNASVGKNGAMKNGDAHSLIKIDNGKYILSLCDGIGSGEKAQRISNLSITLIENFYRAGFDNDTILNSINKLLSLNNEENFSSVDLCVMDFHKNFLDFIKLGATYGFVKKSNTTEVIESSGLPIGVLEEMRPHITKRLIDPFDTIILLSDGISDAFDNKSDLQDFINGLSSTNPQTIADEIMDRAKDLNNGIVKDDMTVLAVRIFPI